MAAECGRIVWTIPRGLYGYPHHVEDTQLYDHFAVNRLTGKGRAH